ncbi:MAG TPA: ribosome biogenesis GTPase YlqF [Burkholderiales bacterium]|nr:ribosome biogenesis GTPase YlqF [Burkholderiales bacterium]
MAIQWFPGHMDQARKNAARAMKTVDVVIEVIDARLPEASSNPLIRDLRAHRQRPCLKVLNKADLADPDVTKQWLDFYNRQEGVTAAALSCKKPADVARIPKLCQQVAPHRNDNFKPLRMMIMGIPNVGKSTLMNALLKRRVAAVGDEPAITKTEQRLDLGSRMSITDTPGLMWPKIRYAGDGMMLAASHAIGVNALVPEEVAMFLADILLDRYPDLLNARYRIDVAEMDAVAVIEAIASRRGAQVKGGGLNLEKASIILLTDYRSGKLGRISLETPATRSEMMAAAALQIDEVDTISSEDDSFDLR